MFAFLFQGVFATVIDPTEKKKRKKSKSDPEGAYIITVLQQRAKFSLYRVQSRF